MQPYQEICPPLPTEISVENWNLNTYYNQQIYQVWKQSYSSKKQGFTDEQRFIAYAYITWRKIWPEISYWVKCNGGWDNIDITYKNNIFTAIMMNIEFLRINKSIEQNVVMSISNSNEFNSQITQYPWWSDKTILGENCLGQLTQLGILRIGLYGYE